jgi:hypothetical protein
MRALILVPAVVVAAGVLGYVACSLCGIDAHAPELIAAAVACVVAAEAAIVPVLLARGASQASVSQAGLVGTLVHLLVAIAIAAVLHLFVRLGSPVLYWMLPFYWITLIALVVVFVRAVKAAPIKQ